MSDRLKLFIELSSKELSELMILLSFTLYLGHNPKIEITVFKQVGHFYFKSTVFHSSKLKSSQYFLLDFGFDFNFHSINRLTLKSAFVPANFIGSS